jgi:hypothetical protein
LLAAPQFAVDFGGLDRDAGRQSGEGGNQALAVAFPGGFVA